MFVLPKNCRILLPDRCLLFFNDRNMRVTISTAIAASNIVVTSCCGRTVGGDAGGE